MELIMGMKLPEEQKMVLGMEMYIIGNDTYALMEVEGETSPWIKERLQVGTWGEVTRIDPQVEILETGEATLIGTEEVRGEDCYVLQIIPDEEQLVDMVLQETSMPGRQESPMTEEVWEEVVKSALVKQWVRKDDFSLAKTEVIMEDEVPSSKVIGYGSWPYTIRMTMTFLSYNYNKQVQIELPIEAEEAISWEELSVKPASSFQVFSDPTTPLSFEYPEGWEVEEVTHPGPGEVWVLLHETLIPDNEIAVRVGFEGSASSYDSWRRLFFSLVEEGTIYTYSYSKFHARDIDGIVANTFIVDIPEGVMLVMYYYPHQTDQYQEVALAATLEEYALHIIATYSFPQEVK